MLSKDLKFLIELVKNASLLINNEIEVKEKDDKGDLVTNIDYILEKYIIDKISKDYPDFSIISEEFNSNNKLTDNCFTIDPIDGTINFANNIPLWGIQVACIKNKRTCASVIYLPKFNELYYADESGAYMNGNPIYVNNYDIKKGLFTIEGPRRILGSAKMHKISQHCRDFYSSAVNFAYVACGRLSATNFVGDNLWDYIPGQFIVEKAGGVIYNTSKMHIAANNESFLNIMKNNSDVNMDEEIIIKKK